jgi:hypothetical protein
MYKKYQNIRWKSEEKRFTKVFQKTYLTLFIAMIANAESYKKSNNFIMLTRESYVKHNSLMLVQGNVGRVKKLAVVVGKSGRGLNITLRNHNSPVGNSPLVILPYI